MATFGQGINPALGRIDYTPFLQGASQGAQMRAQGMQQLGAGLAQGLKEYQANKQVASDAIGETEAIIAQSDSVRKWLSDPNNDSKAAKLAKKLQTNGTLSVNDATTLSSSLRSFLKSEQISELKKQQDFQNSLEQQKLKIEKDRMMNERLNAMRGMFGGGGSEKAIDPVTIRSAGPNGEPIEVSIDRLTGQEISRGPLQAAPRPYRTPEEEAEAAGRAAEERGLAESSTKALDALSASAQAADVEMAKYTEIENLLNADTSTGAGQNWITVTRAAGKRLGLPDEALGDQQKLESLLAEDALMQTRNFMQGQGAVSNAERERVDKAALDARKDKAALKELLGYRKAAAERTLAAQEFRLSLEVDGKKPREIKKSIDKWYRENPFSAFVPASVKPSSSQTGSSRPRIISVEPIN